MICIYESLVIAMYALIPGKVLKKQMRKLNKERGWGGINFDNNFGYLYCLSMYKYSLYKCYGPI